MSTKLSVKVFSSIRRSITSVGIVALTLTLQGCSVARHSVANWQDKTSYLTAYQFVLPGKDASTGAVLNSCASAEATPAIVCSGHGSCQDFFDEVPMGNVSQPKILAFCKCDTYWADPECRTERKSQARAFVLSLFLGVFGADQFYLGFWTLGTMKLLSFGGFGVWWLFDMMRIGTSQVYTVDQFAIAGDLPHFVYVLSVLALMGVLGFIVSIRSISRQRVHKARELLMIQAEINHKEEPLSGPGMYGSTVVHSVQPTPGPGMYVSTVVRSAGPALSPRLIGSTLVRSAAPALSPRAYGSTLVRSAEPPVVTSVTVSPPVATGPPSVVASMPVVRRDLGYTDTGSVASVDPPPFRGFHGYGTTLKSLRNDGPVGSVRVGKSRSLSGLP